jgi:hypothetical protein
MSRVLSLSTEYGAHLTCSIRAPLMIQPPNRAAHVCMRMLHLSVQNVNTMVSQWD